MEIRETHVRYRGRRWNLASNILVTDQGTELEREYIQHPGSVLLLPVLDDGRIVMISVFRHAVRQTLWELPAGTAEVGEDPAVTAARELEEETGYSAERLTEVRRFYPAPGLTDERMVLFLAEGLHLGSTRCEADEEIAVQPMTLEAILGMIDEGVVADAKTMVAIWWWARQRQ